MKRYARMSNTAICMIPRKAIAWIILSLAIMTMMSFMLIEVRRILGVRGLVHKNPRQKADYSLVLDVNKSNQSPETPSQKTAMPIANIRQTKAPWKYDDVVEALFEDYPYCQSKPYLLILIASAPENFERREAIRKSWADTEGWKLQAHGLKSKTIFLIGRSSTKFLNVLLKNENDINGDILIGKYLDTYRNLTVKVMHGFTWAVRHCQPTYLLKTDDDCFVNVPLLVQFLWKYNPVPVKLYAGKVRWSAPVVRDPNSRWFVPDSEYSRQRYAPYAVGAGYVNSYDVLQKLVAFSDRMHIFPNEDAYVGTVLNIAGIRPTYSGRFVTHSGPWQMCNFLYLFVVHRVRATRQSEYKEMSNKAAEQCSLDHVVKDWV